MFNLPIHLLLLTATVNLTAEIIFDNTQTEYNGVYYPSNFEYGDEVNVVGTARTITEFQCQYYGNFASSGAEKVRVRFYQTDSTWTNDLGQVIHAPGTLLYASNLLPIYPDYNTLTLSGLNILITSNVVWTIQFTGLTGKYGNQAGLTFYNPATIGFSYDDFWVKLPAPAGWTPQTFQHNPVANFAARVIASPDPPLAITAYRRLADGSQAVQIQGPTYQSGVLEASADLRRWMTIQYFVLAGQPLQFIDHPATPSSLRFLRVKPLPGPSFLLDASQYATSANPQFEFRLTGTPCHNYVVEASTDWLQWFPINSGYLNGLHATFTDTHVASFPSRRFYRVVAAPDSPVVFNSIAHLADGTYQLMLYGPRGRSCLLQASANLGPWQDLATHTFSYLGTDITIAGNVSYTAGVIKYTDTQTLGSGLRSYRAILLP